MSVREKIIPPGSVVKVDIPSLAMSEQDLVKVLESAIYPGAKLESIKLVIGYCRANQLDPMQKPVHIVPMNVKDAKTGDYGWRDVVMPGIGLYRTNAARTGEYVGIDDAEFGETKTLKVGEAEFLYPEWCSVTVHRQVRDLPRSFSSGRVYWLETYATAGKDTKAPNAMWKKRPFGQLEKCAEAMALRRAFPELGAAATAEEMEGKTIEQDDAPVAPALEGPKSKTPEPESKAESRTEPPPPTGGTGTISNGNDKPLNATQQAILRKNLERAALTEIDVKTKFGENVDGLKVSQFNAVQDWIKERSGG